MAVGSAFRTKRRDRPLWAHLAAFGLILLVPAITIAAIGISLYQDLERERVEQTAVNLATAVRRTIDSQIGNMVTVLNTLATSDYLDRRDYAAFHAAARHALQGTDTKVILVDRAMRQLLNTRVRYGTALPPSPDRETVNAAMLTGRPQVSNMFKGTVAGQLVFNVVVPVVRNGAIVDVLIGTENATSLSRLLERPESTAGWTLGVFDRTGVIMAESGGGRRIGTSINAEARQQSAAPSGVGTVTGSAGVKMLRGHARSGLTGWTVASFIPQDAVDAPLRRSWMIFTVAVLGLIAVSVAVATLFARVTSGAIEDLRQGARALGSGAPVQPLMSSLREANEVSDELVNAATLRNQREEQLRFLMSELSHRTKNILNVALAIMRQTRIRCSNVNDFEERLGGRLVALGRSIDALIRGDWKGADLGGIVRSHLFAFAEPEGGRLDIVGPPVTLTAEASQPLGIALHELATNASKYGALSVPTGKVTIGWELSQPDRKFLHVTWRETGGPPVQQPQTSGFGRLVIEQLVPDQLGAVVTTIYAAEGLRWQIDIPIRFVAAVGDAPSASPAGTPEDASQRPAA